MPLPSPELTKKGFHQFFLQSFLWVLSLSLPVYKTQNIITMEPNKQVRSSFPYLMLYSIYFALIKKISVLQVHFPHKTYFKSCNAWRATRKTDGFSWYAARATRTERVNVHCSENCPKRTPIGSKQGVRFRRYPL